MRFHTIRQCGNGSSAVAKGKATATRALKSAGGGQSLTQISQLQGNEQAILSKANRDELDIPGTAVSRIVDGASRAGRSNEFPPSEMIRDPNLFAHLSSAQSQKGKSELGTEFAKAADRSVANLYVRASNGAKNDIVNPRSPDYHGNDSKDWRRIAEKTPSPALRAIAIDLSARAQKLEAATAKADAKKFVAKKKTAKTSRGDDNFLGSFGGTSKNSNSSDDDFLGSF